MNAMEKSRLSKEAQMQLAALKRIGQWRLFAFAISAIGVAAAYAGMAGTKPNLFLGIGGIAVIVIGTAAAVILNLGLRNGRRNVQKILDILQKEQVNLS